MGSLSNFNQPIQNGKLLMILWSTVLLVRGLYLAITRQGRSKKTEERIAKVLLYMEILSSGLVSILGYANWVWRPLVEFDHTPTLRLDKQEQQPKPGSTSPTTDTNQTPAPNQGAEFSRQVTIERNITFSQLSRPQSTRIITAAVFIATSVHAFRLARFLIDQRERCK